MAALVGVAYPSHRHLRPVYVKSDAAGGLLRKGSGAYIPIPKDELACNISYGIYGKCLKGFYTPDGLWVFVLDVDYTNDDTNDDTDDRFRYACDDPPISDCDQFCNTCAGGPIEPGACSADGQYFCFPGDTNDDRWIPHQASCFKCVSGENCCFATEGGWDFSCPNCAG